MRASEMKGKRVLELSPVCKLECAIEESHQYVGCRGSTGETDRKM